MGQYFYFSHEICGKNTKGIPSNGDLEWFPKLNMFDNDVIKKIFEEVIQINGWPPGKVSAQGDEDDYIVYTGDKTLIIY